MKYVTLISLALVMGLASGCGSYVSTDTGPAGPAGPKGDTGAPGADAPVPPAPVVDTVQEAIDKLVLDENAYRLGLGQTMLSEGLSCTLYTITGGDRIQASISGHNTLTGITTVASYLYKGAFNQPDSAASTGLNVLPLALRPLYTNMYLLRCQGSIVILDTDYYSFELNSDDASLLYIDGAKVIDNDNNHGATTVTGMKYLRKGVHTFRLDYAQAGGGNQSLILTQGGASISGKLYYH